MRFHLLISLILFTFPFFSSQNLTDTQKLVASDGAAHDNFGYSICLSGNTIAIGGPFVSGKPPGAVYIFLQNASNYWNFQQKIAAPDQGGIWFGNSISLSGNIMVIGAPYAGDLQQGAAYIFAQSGSNWAQQQVLSASDGNPNDNFGWSVSVSGTTLVVGSPNAGNQTEGAAYIFTQSGSTWNLQQRISSSDPALNQNFGYSVSLSEKGSAVAIGAPYRAAISKKPSKPAAPLQGSAYVFTQTGNSWTQQQKLTAKDGNTGDYFGNSVSLSGTTLVVGAQGILVNTSIRTGAAYVFTQSGSTWSQQQKLLAKDANHDDEFGGSVSISGTTIAVGAYFATVVGHPRWGAVYVFTQSGTSWAQQQKLSAKDGNTGDFFGWAVSVAGNNVAIGVPDANVGGNPRQGAAYVFTQSGSNSNQQQNFSSSPLNH